MVEDKKSGMKKRKHPIKSSKKSDSEARIENTLRRRRRENFTAPLLLLLSVRLTKASP